MIAFEQRACTVLFNLLKAHQLDGPFLLPSNICPVVPLTFFKARREFEFVDIAPGTLCIDPRHILERWTSKDRPTPAGLLYVRTYGAVFDAGSLFHAIKELSPTALIVDDRCLCEPRFDEAISPYADAALYSTGYAKFVDLGFGGVGVLRSGVPYEKTSLRFCPDNLQEITQSYKRYIEEQRPFFYDDCDWLCTEKPGYSWAEYQELVRKEQVRILELKREINAIYASGLPELVQFPADFQSWRFNIHVSEKAAVLDAIRKEGLFASGHYESLDGVFGAGTGEFSRFVHHHVINLFNDRYFSVPLAERMVECLRGLDFLHPSELFA